MPTEPTHLTAEELDWRDESEHHSNCTYGCCYQKLLAALDSLEAARRELAELKNPTEIVRGDMFWDDSDPERAEMDAEEVFIGYSPCQIVKIQQATREPDFYGFYTGSWDGEGEKYFFFASLEEAEAAIPAPPEQQEGHASLAPHTEKGESQ